MSQGAAGIGIVLVVHHATGSLAVAGAVAASFSIGAGIARPLQGRLMDGGRLQLVVAVCSAAHALALTTVVIVARSGGLVLGLILCAAVAGLALMPVSSSMRVAWGALGGGDRTAAYSLVYFVQELAIFLGPLLLGLFIAVTSPELALTMLALISGLGGIGYAVALEPLPTSPVHKVESLFGSSGIRTVLEITMLLGGAIGAIQIAVSTLASSRGVPATAGLLTASLSLGAIAGAIVYGWRRWTTEPVWRLVVLLGFLATVTLPLALLGTILFTGILLAVAGAALNPALATLSLLVDEYTITPSAEAFGWMSTAIAAGTALGNGMGGILADSGGPAAAFVVAGVSALLATVLALVRASASSALT